MDLRPDVFQAIADPTKRANLMLAASHLEVAGVIASQVKITRPKVPKHLQTLTERELLEKKYSGRVIYFYIAAKYMNEVADFIGHSAERRMTSLLP